MYLETKNCMNVCILQWVSDVVVMISVELAVDLLLVLLCFKNVCDPGTLLKPEADFIAGFFCPQSVCDLIRPSGAKPATDSVVALF
jgi:hypothetical protein